YATSSRWSASRSISATSAPSSAKARAMARPMPRPAPVTAATFPVSDPSVTSDDRLTAVHEQDVPVDEVRPRAGQEHDGVRDVVWSGKPPRGEIGEVPGAVLLVVELVAGHLGVDG